MGKDAFATHSGHCPSCRAEESLGHPPSVLFRDTFGFVGEVPSATVPGFCVCGHADVCLTPFIHFTGKGTEPGLTREITTQNIPREELWLWSPALGRALAHSLLKRSTINSHSCQPTCRTRPRCTLHFPCLPAGGCLLTAPAGTRNTPAAIHSEAFLSRSLLFRVPGNGLIGGLLAARIQAPKLSG